MSMRCRAILLGSAATVSCLMSSRRLAGSWFCSVSKIHGLYDCVVRDHIGRVAKDGPVSSVSGRRIGRRKRGSFFALKPFHLAEGLVCGTPMPFGGSSGPVCGEVLAGAYWQDRVRRARGAYLKSRVAPTRGAGLSQ